MQVVNTMNLGGTTNRPIIDFNSAKGNSNLANLSYSPISSAYEQAQFNLMSNREAQKWQEYMSNTSHQREVEDLIKAGLNPVLSANNGANAYTTNAASVNTNDLSSMSGLLGALINANAMMNVANINAKAQMYSADVNSHTQANYQDALKEINEITQNTSNKNNIRSNVFGLVGDIARLPILMAMYNKGFNKVTK